MLPEGTENTFYFNLILTALTAGMKTVQLQQSKFSKMWWNFFLDCKLFQLVSFSVSKSPNGISHQQISKSRYFSVRTFYNTGYGSINWKIY